MVEQKKILFSAIVLLTLLSFIACSPPPAVYKPSLKYGMTKDEVISRWGSPNRIKALPLLQPTHRFNYESEPKEEWIYYKKINYIKNEHIRLFFKGDELSGSAPASYNGEVIW
jgi:hypothetical protein